MSNTSRKQIASSLVENSEDPPKKKRGSPPGRTVESRENQLIAMATDLAAKQMRDGRASSQVITHFLKLGTSLAKLEAEKLRQETLLLAAKSRNLDAQKNVEELYAEALKAMGIYSGNRTHRSNDADLTNTENPNEWTDD